jgi:hypothetical protein
MCDDVNANKSLFGNERETPSIRSRSLTSQMRALARGVRPWSQGGAGYGARVRGADRLVTGPGTGVRLAAGFRLAAEAGCGGWNGGRAGLAGLGHVAGGSWRALR